jgi:hypothetical protein
MSWFAYGKDLNNSSSFHRKRKGVWLRYHSNPDIVKAVKKNGNKRLFETVVRVVVDEYDKKEDKIWLEVWCQNIFDPIRRKHRYNVFYIFVSPDESWVCEGDLGKGLENYKDNKVL